MTDYNYSTFEMAREVPAFEAFSSHLHVGQKAPSFALEDLASGNQVELKDLWKDGPLIVEFGSFT